MKKSLVLLSVLSTSLLMGSCVKEEKKIETNELGVPMNIANIIMGDTYQIDTLYKAPDQVAIYIDNPDYTQHLVYINETIIANSPNLEVNSLASNLYQISDLLRSAKVNFSSKESVEKFQRTFPQYPEFSTVVLGDTTQTGQKAVFAYAVSMPSEKIKNPAAVLRWVESCIDDSMKYNPSLKVFGQRIEGDFFHRYEKKESDFTYTDSRSMLVYAMTTEYVTYHDYFWVFLGGAHGMYGDRFVSYSFVDDCPVTYDYLFKPDCEDEIRELIYEAITDDEDFMSNHKITSLSQARTYIQRNLMGEPLPIPQPGLTPDGVVFCYQPYEIAPYADGEFILTIPYAKLQPYLAVKMDKISKSVKK